MRVLVTGSAGKIGQRLVADLLAAGYEVRSFDRTAQKKGQAWEHIPGDLRDIYLIRRIVQGVDAVIHAGAIASDSRAVSPEDLLAINVQGTWNLLLACVEAGIERMVFFSSVNALGAVGGHKPAVYLPIDDDYPRHPMSPYQLSKHVGEEMCRSFSEKHGLSTLCLRPVYVAAPEDYSGWFRNWTEERRLDGAKTEYWAYVDIRDVCAATLLCLTTQGVTHDAFLLTADDTTLETPSDEAVQRCYPETPWPKVDRAAYFAENPHRSLMNCDHAKQVLGWQPKHSWRDEK